MLGGAIVGKEAASVGTWQHRVFLASQYIGLNDPVDDLSKNDEAYELFGPIDNTSHQCSGYLKTAEDGLCVPCPDDKPLWWLILRWLKMMMLKIARSYHAKPLILIIAPLFVGLYIGYWLGSRSRPPKQFNAAARNGSQSNQILTRLRGWVSVICFYLSGCFAENPSPLAEAHKNDRFLDQSKSLEKKSISVSTDDGISLQTREGKVRENLRSNADTYRESGVDVSQVPRHVAVIMDGNRRYGKAKYGSASKGHWDGSSKLIEFSKWCIAEQVSVLTVYAFSTENWNRDPAEVASLMAIFSKYCDELRVEALKRNMKILVLSTDSSRIPAHVQEGLKRMVGETRHCSGLTMNICMSYGSRGELVAASRSLAADAVRGELNVESIDENEFQKRLLTYHCGDPDVLIRTSGEVRISNFLLWQLAYTEFFFFEKTWPAVEKEDLLEVIRTYAKGRIRRFGK